MALELVWMASCQTVMAGAVPGADAAEFADRMTTPREMERLYSEGAKVVTVIAGDFNTDPTDARFASEQTFSLLRQDFECAWENIPLAERVTLPAKGRYPDASF